MNSIEVDHLKKTFRSHKKEAGLRGSIKSLFYRHYITKNAIDDFSMTIKEGEIVALLGPNGAGKTTLMKILTGIIVPSQGEIKVLGHNPSKREMAFRKKIALVMGQKSQLWWDLPAKDSLDLLRRYYEIESSVYTKKVNELGQLLNVIDLLHIPIRRLSLGERMKLELMASLLHSPQIIFLDEPTIGLDLIAQENVRNFIKEYRRLNQATIIVTSHYMADIQALCERLVLVMEGKKTFDGPIKEFEHYFGEQKIVSFEFQNPILSENFPEIPWSSFLSTWNESRTRVEMTIPNDQLKAISTKIIANFPISGFNTEKVPIERVMKSIMIESKQGIV